MEIFSLSSKSNVTVIPNDQLWSEIDSFVAPSTIFDEQGEAHEEIDIRLIEKIDAYLVPLLGDYEKTESWFHSMLCNGDGIRAISLNQGSLSNEVILNLQAMLLGESVAFTILLNLHREYASNEDTKIGTLLICADKLVISKEVVSAYT